MEAIRKITKQTLVPIGLVISLLGGTFWLTTMFVEARSNASFVVDSVKELKSKQDEYNQTLMSINERLSRIEGKLDLNRRSR